MVFLIVTYCAIYSVSYGSVIVSNVLNWARFVCVWKELSVFKNLCFGKVKYHSLNSVFLLYFHKEIPAPKLKS